MQVEINDLINVQRTQLLKAQEAIEKQALFRVSADSFSACLRDAHSARKASSKSSDLKQFLQDKFDGKPQVNEEEVYQALVEYSLESISPDAAKQYADNFQELAKANTSSNGYVPFEDLTNRALDSLVSAGSLAADKVSAVRTDAFRNSQLDNNASALWDSIGGGEDNTVAISAVSQAIESVEANLNGTRPNVSSTGPGDPNVSAISSVPLSSAPIADDSSVIGETLNANDGKGGFLWKPVSDSNGRLVVLLPTQMNGYIQNVEVHRSVPPSSSTLIETGKFASMGNGGRCHFRFNKPGSGYGNNVHLVVWGTDGSYVSYNIARGGSRWD